MDGDSCLFWMAAVEPLAPCCGVEIQETVSSEDDES